MGSEYESACIETVSNFIHAKPPPTITHKHFSIFMKMRKEEQECEQEQEGRDRSKKVGEKGSLVEQEERNAK